MSVLLLAVKLEAKSMHMPLVGVVQWGKEE
jgi:hypothetical protein